MKTSTKRIGALVALLGVTASLAGCGGGKTNTVEPGTVNTNTDQTEFKIISGISALSGGYDSNEVLNTMAQNAGISITWDTMSDSLSEQVNIRIAGNDLPDAFNAVGFSNYDLTEYGEDGTFIDLTPYIGGYSDVRYEIFT